MSQSIVDLSRDIPSALRWREREKTPSLTPAELREKARADWLQLRKGAGKGADKADQNEHTRESGAAENRAKNKGRSRDDDDFSL